jgi:hypothetical protein
MSTNVKYRPILPKIQFPTVEQLFLPPKVEPNRFLLPKDPVILPLIAAIPHHFNIQMPSSDILNRKCVSLTRKSNDVAVKPKRKRRRPKKSAADSVNITTHLATIGQDTSTDKSLQSCLQWSCQQ